MVSAPVVTAARRNGCLRRSRRGWGHAHGRAPRRRPASGDAGEFIHAGRAGVTWLGVEGFWTADRPGVPRVTRRTARKPWPRACRRITAWRQANRHRPGNAVVNGLTARGRGPDRDSGVHGNANALSRVCDWAMTGAYTWRKRRGGTRKRCSGARCTQLLDAVHLERPRITAHSRRSV